MPKKLGPAQESLNPLAIKLAEAGHLRLALKTITFAARTDWALYMRDRSRARYTRKLEKLLAETTKLESKAHAALFPDH